MFDRTGGQFLMAKPFARVSWAKEIGPDGRPVALPGMEPTLEGIDVCPGVAGATNWMSPAYSPQTGLLYVAAREQCDRMFGTAQTYRPGGMFWASAFMGIPEEKEWGALRALDPQTGAQKWEFRYHSAPWGGALATSGGLVFAGDMEGYLMALDAATGKVLWRTPTGRVSVNSLAPGEAAGVDSLRSNPMLPEPSPRLGLFEVLPQGAGGTGEVYRARAKSLARDVTVNVVPG